MNAFSTQQHRVWIYLMNVTVRIQVMLDALTKCRYMVTDTKFTLISAKFVKYQSFNSTPHSAAFMSQWIRSGLVQKMACCLFGAKQLSKPMLAYFNWTHRNKLQRNLNQTATLFIHENASENTVCEMVAILSRERWVNRKRINSTHTYINLKTVSYSNILIAVFPVKGPRALWLNIKQLSFSDVHSTDITVPNENLLEGKKIQTRVNKPS